ncbi:hypothetical protein CG392_02965 [Gardnerella vaginalis]|nr:hypothetical protein CG392_02965 [Gardnerella vaginalis]
MSDHLHILSSVGTNMLLYCFIAMQNMKINGDTTMFHLLLQTNFGLRIRLLILNANRHKHLEFSAILHVRSHYNTFAIFTKVKNITAILATL